MENEHSELIIGYLQGRLHSKETGGGAGAADKTIWW